MPIHLQEPAPQPGGPDGQGRNRIELWSITGGDQCALRPRSWATLVESRDTRRARWGGFGPCTNGGDCRSCPLLTAKTEHMDAFGDRVLVRIHERHGPMLMNRPEDGWASLGFFWSWSELSRLEGWDIGPKYTDEHSEGFWLIRSKERR